ncbi:MAG: HD domain-containing protein [Desulfobacteraceae bacterium]|nr:MAG: HD domain-containing protein [Desulfobacteraceae bacterium]
MISKCPGQDTRFWKPDDVYSVECPKCGQPVEFFKDDIRRRCKKCGHMFINPRLNLGCARWCQYADQCVGAIGKEEFKEIITLAMKEYFEGDQERIDNALKVLRFAEDILEKEEGNPKVVIAAALLHDIGIHEVEKKPERAKESNQEKDRLPIVRGILEKSGSKKEVTEEVRQIIESHQYPKKIDTLNSKIVYDAVQLVNFRGEKDVEDKGKKKKIIKKVLLTPAGKKIAEEIYNLNIV